MTTTTKPKPCPNCKGIISRSIIESYVGCRFPCPHCKVNFVIPNAWDAKTMRALRARKGAK